MSQTELIDKPTTHLTGVGPQMAQKLEKIGIVKIEDILFHLPSRYLDKTRVTPMRHLKPSEHAVIEGIILDTQVKIRKRRTLECQFSDGSSMVWMRLFHFNNTQKENLKEGMRLRCYGQARLRKGGFEMVHPEYRVIHDDKPLEVEQTLTPIYPTTEGLAQRSLLNLTDNALSQMTHTDTLPDYIPKEILEKHDLMALKDAVVLLHRPGPDVSLSLLDEGKHPAQLRLAFEELLAHQLCLRQLRVKAQKEKAPPLTESTDLKTKFLSGLSYELTAAQKRVSDEIKQDLEKDLPMLRLVQGDVGSGKTVVSALATLQAVSSGFQVALMAPTELLSQQLYTNFSAWLGPLGIEVLWLTGKHKGRDKNERLAFIDSGAVQVIVGTHALFQKQVTFNKLGLIIIDEQHRFGVHQRLALREKGSEDSFSPHQLIMTATPIPRTLTMTVYADLDVSVIDELPKGRKPVNTVAISNTKRPEVIDRVEKACKAGQQVYWVCTLIEISEELQAEAAEKTFEQLSGILPDLNISLIHGRMKSDIKATQMAAFKEGKVDVLVATTVIEVGVDVPNANLMVIENAERLGLSQLHQLRGRVGRGTELSYCVLLYQTPLSKTATERLALMRKTNDGFKIAKRDLQLRGPGEVLGKRQSGLAKLKVADLMAHQYLVSDVQKAADCILRQYPKHVLPIINRWVTEGGAYGQVG